MDKASPPLDLAALDIFRTVAAEGSVTRAAERLQRVQSNVTTRVRQLEADLGTPLFLREGKRMALTPEGEVLRGYADRLLAPAEEATRAVLEPGCTYRGVAQDWFATRTPPMQTLELGSYHAILASVAGGGSVGIVPRSVLQLSPHAALLAQHPLTTLQTLLVWRHGYRSAALDALQQVLRD